MKETTLKNATSVALVLAHAATLVLVLVLYICHGLTDEQATTTVGMIVPMLATVVGLAVKHIVDSKKAKRAGPQVSSLYVFGVIFFTGSYLVTIAVLLLLKAFNVGLKSFEAFKVCMGIAETIFGAYTGKVLSSLFDPPTKKEE